MPGAALSCLRYKFSVLANEYRVSTMIDPVDVSWRTYQLSSRRAALVIHGAVNHLDTDDHDSDTGDADVGRGDGSDSRTARVA